jgi:ubiquinol-cytochrome c reductase iron-sulfur subunit
MKESMTDDDQRHATGPAEGDDTARHPDDAAEQPEHPHRVIGTPSPAARRLLGGDGGPGGRTLLDPAAGDGGQDVVEAKPGFRVAPRDLAKEKRAERTVAALFLLSAVAGIGFIAAYVGLDTSAPHSIDQTLQSNLALGGSMAVVFLAMGAGMVMWVRRLMPNVEVTEQRHPISSPPEERQEFQKTFLEGAEQSGFVKRPLLRRTLIAASVPLALAPVVLLRDLGPLPEQELRYTVWRKGLRLTVYGTNAPIKPEDFDTPGGLITVIPEGYQDDDDALAKAASIIIKFQPGELQAPTNLSWCVQNIVCYSKICTHVGCPVALYEQTTHHILCPCHQSTFNAPYGATVIFGPAPRPLPQLPLMVDSEGYLAAAGDFDEPVGPSFWERG